MLSYHNVSRINLNDKTEETYPILLAEKLALALSEEGKQPILYTKIRRKK